MNLKAGARTRRMVAVWNRLIRWLFLTFVTSHDDSCDLLSSFQHLLLIFSSGTNLELEPPISQRQFNSSTGRMPPFVLAFPDHAIITFSIQCDPNLIGVLSLNPSLVVNNWLWGTLWNLFWSWWLGVIMIMIHEAPLSLSTARILYVIFHLVSHCLSLDYTRNLLGFWSQTSISASDHHETWITTGSSSNWISFNVIAHFFFIDTRHSRYVHIFLILPVVPLPLSSLQGMKERNVNGTDSNVHRGFNHMTKQPWSG